MSITMSKMQASGLAAAILGPVAAFCWSPLDAATPDPAKMQWVVNWDEATCTLMRAGADEPLMLRVDNNLALSRVSVSLANKTGNKDLGKGVKQLDVVLLPSGEKVTGDSLPMTVKEGVALAAVGLDEALLDKFAASRGIALESKGTRLMEMSYPAAGNAVKALRTCISTRLGEWGIDAAAQAALKQRAVAREEPATLITDRDYPASITRARMPVAVIARYDITEDGKVQNCRAANPGTKSELVDAACLIFEKRLSYKPALGADGKPVATQAITVVAYTPALPGGRR